MWPKGRRRSAPPVLLPSLDRLSTLIERVVELIDAVGATQTPAPESAAEPTQETPAVAADDVDYEVWLAFVPSPQGYRLIEERGAPPLAGNALDLDDGRYRVLR